ncbi:hypothetical protein [Azospirillum sp.]|uniref:hypothetical protein n=1 Tax=Azospirillum sp. TaxID=34012 RepID=UPI002D755D65|nr:hypothetical protein [Azospirillum sp.]HYD69562.1 hypothetical protein [Azospirillum sp.]
MTPSTSLRLALVGALALAVAGCQSGRQSQVVLSTKSPVELRAMQARAFDTADRAKTLRTVIVTFQDLGYGIDKVEPAAGTVSATKLGKLRMTATVYPRGQSQTVVRGNALLLNPGVESQVDDPAFYQQLFFEPLAKAMFLTALDVPGTEDAPPAAGAAANTTAKP